MGHDGGVMEHEKGQARRMERPRILVADTFADQGLEILQSRAQVDIRRGLGEAR